MTVERLRGVPGFSIDRVAAAAGSDPKVLRLENLDTDLPPPEAALAATRVAIGDDDANSYLPFTGQAELRELVARHGSRLSGVDYDRDRSTVITAGGTEARLNALLAIVDVGDEVILTDPTYAGMIYRVRLAGGVPRLVPFKLIDGAWRLDTDALTAAVTDRTCALLLMNPSMPSGAVMNREEWEVVAELCRTRSLWLIYNAAMERILFDGIPYIHPASLPGMAERTLTVGSVSKEYRMIGWRVGWVVGPPEIMDDIRRVGIYNVVTPVGLTQRGAVAALRAPEADLEAAVAEWGRRRDLLLEELHDLPIISAAGGWSMLMDVGALSFDSFAASDRLLERGRIAATPMKDWGQVNGDQFVRFVFSNEPLARLAGIRDRVRASLLE